MNDFAGNILGI